MALILITGVAGFIGSNVARALSLSGNDIVGSDRLRTGDKWRNLSGIRLHDLITPEALPDWLTAYAGRVDRIIHLGAVSDTMEVDADRIVRDNIRLSLDLWAWCARHDTSLIYASSAATYGDGKHGFVDSEDEALLERLRPLNAYGWSKHFVDRRIMSDVATERPTPQQWVGLKFFNVYGPGEGHKGSMKSLITKILPVIKEAQCVKLFRSYNPRYEDGEQLRDFVYVDDVVSVIEWLSETPSVSGLFNLGSGIARTWNDVVRVASTCLGQPTRIEYVAMPAHLQSQYQYFTQAPIEKLRSAGWSGQATSLEEGISKYVGGLS